METPQLSPDTVAPTTPRDDERIIEVSTIPSQGLKRRVSTRTLNLLLRETPLLMIYRVTGETDEARSVKTLRHIEDTCPKNYRPPERLETSFISLLSTCSYTTRSSTYETFDDPANEHYFLPTSIRYVHLRPSFRSTPHSSKLGCSGHHFQAMLRQ